MATYAVKIEEINRIGVYHSTTETMYSPLWDEDYQLDAYVFAWIYGDRQRRAHIARTLGIGDAAGLLIFGEKSQQQVQSHIRAFFDEKLGDDERNPETLLPKAWIDILNGGEQDLDPEDYIQYNLCDLANNFDRGESCVEFVMDELLDWKPTPAAK